MPLPRLIVAPILTPANSVKPVGSGIGIFADASLDELSFRTENTVPSSIMYIPVRSHISGALMRLLTEAVMERATDNLV